jgi:hypothetical protein
LGKKMEKKNKNWSRFHSLHQSILISNKKNIEKLSCWTILLWQNSYQQ